MLYIYIKEIKFNKRIISRNFAYKQNRQCDPNSSHTDRYRGGMPDRAKPASEQGNSSQNA